MHYCLIVLIILGSNEAADESFKDPEPQRTRIPEKPNGHIEVRFITFVGFPHLSKLIQIFIFRLDFIRLLSAD